MRTTTELPDDVIAGFAALPSMLQELSRSEDIHALCARASELCRTVCRMRRTVVLTLEGPWLTPHRCGALEDSASDVLRRTVLAAPIAVRHATEERRLLDGQGQDPGGESALAVELGLQTHGFGLIAYAGTPLGLIVADRPGPAVSSVERSLLSACGGIVAVALRNLVVNSRVRQLSAELRYLTSSAESFILDVLDDGIELPGSGRHLPTFSGPGLGEPAPISRADDILTAREQEVAEALATGLSNREIARLMHLSPDTVKGYVTQILRKLEASNRAEAVARYMRLAR